jgi:hypothetical protein
MALSTIVGGLRRATPNRSPEAMPMPLTCMAMAGAPNASALATLAVTPVCVSIDMFTVPVGFFAPVPGLRPRALRPVASKRQPKIASRKLAECGTTRSQLARQVIAESISLDAALTKGREEQAATASDDAKLAEIRAERPDLADMLDAICDVPTDPIAGAQQPRIRNFTGARRS